MLGRIVVISEDNRHLQVSRGFLVVKSTIDEHEELGKVALDDIATVIAEAHGISYSNNLLVALAERGAPFVLCGANHNAIGMLISIDGNYQQAKRFDAQIAAGLPLKKRLWASIIKAKLTQQAAVLNAVGVNDIPLKFLVAKVRSGDPDNFEAQGARLYWRMLLGQDFRRDQSSGGINALLNYGYTVLRACTARAVVAAGLHPTLGLHHQNAQNAMRLVDDLMEPFRPMIDINVWQLVQNNQTEVTSETKRSLIMCLYRDMHTSKGMSPVMVCIQDLATSLAQIFIGEKTTLDLPLVGVPLDQANISS